MIDVLLALVIALLWALESRHRWKKLALQEQDLLKATIEFSKEQERRMLEVARRLDEVGKR